MTPAPLIDMIESLEARGVRFRLEGEKIKAALPDPSTPEILQGLEALRAQREEVRRVIMARVSSTSVQCPHCRGEGRCDCLSCGRYEVRAQWFPSGCAVCGGTGRRQFRVQ